MIPNLRGLLLVVMAAGAAAQNRAPSGTGGFVGSNACKICHADIWLNFYKNPHFKSMASGKEPPEPHRLRRLPRAGRSARGSARRQEPPSRAHSRLMPQAGARSLPDLPRARFSKGQHPPLGAHPGRCGLHHLPFHPPFAHAQVPAGQKADASCATAATPASARSLKCPRKHRVNEGFMECSDCHNPHGAFAPTWRMSDRPAHGGAGVGQRRACLKCHVDKRGPFVYEHPPVRVEGCEICHFPARLDQRRACCGGRWCLRCAWDATTAAASGTRNNGVPIQTSQHNLLDPRYQHCTTCHVRIHGSNTDEYFLR